MRELCVYSERHSPRLEYVLQWLFREVLQVPWRLTNDVEDAGSQPFVLSYGREFPKALFVPDAGLLWEKGVTVHNPSMGTWGSLPAIYFFTTTAGLPFDLFSALFFLLSRYEEYYPYGRDKHGRYPPEESLLFKQGWLRRPLADEWVEHFREELSKRFFSIARSEFAQKLTYDIDIAYSYRHKGFIRSIGGLMKDLSAGRIGSVVSRLATLTGVQRDPFDCFDWLMNLHSRGGYQPIYFILCTLRATDFDKNNDPRSSAMQRLVRQLSEEGLIGLHPSYYSSRSEVFAAEKAYLEHTIGKAVSISRQHYVRMNLPETYRFLHAQAIHDDYSMGYGSKLGFRAGTGRSFLWYDLEAEQSTTLRVHPFCFMDSAARYEEGLIAEEAFEVLEGMEDKVRYTGSQLITVFHNFSLGKDPGWKNWRALYDKFVTRFK